MEEKKISIIIPVYGVEKYIKQCLESVINQSYKNLEIIIINDGTEDDSMKIVEKYLSDKDKYITVTFCEQSGDKLVTKGTYAKMARGEMVRYMAEKEIENPADVQTFDRLGYNFRRDLSSEIEYVFERKIME